MWFLDYLKWFTSSCFSRKSADDPSSNAPVSGLTFTLEKSGRFSVIESKVNQLMAKHGVTEKMMEEQSNNPDEAVSGCIHTYGQV